MSSKKISIYQLKITMQDSKPPIWRRIQVKSDTTLEKLHSIIQTVMGWYNSHLHQFIIDGIYYGLADPDFDFDIKNERGVKLESVVSQVKDSFIYEYDFGDSWEHKVLLEKITSFENGVNYPTCLDGKRACPPEDCGGIWGYYDLLETLKDPSDPEYEETLEWIGEEFDPEFFDLDEINDELKRFK